MTATVPAVPASWLTEPPQLADISTVEGWQSYVVHRGDYQPPPLLRRDEYDNLDPHRRMLYNYARRTAVANPPLYMTPMGHELSTQVTQTLNNNTMNAAPGVRTGMLISADAGLGKSTLIRDIAATFDTHQRDKAHIWPSIAGNRDRWIPVAWVNVPPKVSIGGLCRDILDFYGEVPTRRSPEHEMTARVRQVMTACGTRLLVLDDITRLKMHREADQNAADFIRALMETGATVLGIGVDVESSGLLSEGRADPRNRHLLTQTRRRFTVHTLRGFSNDTEERHKEWMAHLLSIENDIPLLDKKPGMPTGGDMPAYLLHRTGGVIGTLTRLVTQSAQAVVDRTPAGPRTGEYLTRDDFASVVLDHAAEHQSRASELPASAATKKSRRARNGAFDGTGRRSALPS